MTKYTFPLLRSKMLWAMLIGVLASSYYISVLLKAKLIVENDTPTSLEFTVSFLGVADKESFSVGAGRTKTIHFSGDRMPKGKLLICAERNRCQYPNYICRGSGSCSGNERKKHVEYSALRKLEEKKPVRGIAAISCELCPICDEIGEWSKRIDELGREGREAVYLIKV